MTDERRLASKARAMAISERLPGESLAAFEQRVDAEAARRSRSMPRADAAPGSFVARFG